MQFLNLGEFLLNEISKQFKIPISIIRYHNIYGPRMGYNHVVPALIKKYLIIKKQFYYLDIMKLELFVILMMQ